MGVPGSPNRASNRERRLKATSRNMNSINGITHIGPYDEREIDVTNIFPSYTYAHKQTHRKRSKFVCLMFMTQAHVWVVKQEF